MNITLFLTRSLGIIFVVLGLSMAFNKKYTAIAIQEMMQNKGILWLGGFMAVAMGAVFIALNNVWTWGLPLLITILGWAALLKGLVILLFPEWTSALYKKYAKDGILIFGGIVCVVLGLLLVYVGYV